MYTAAEVIRTVPLIPLFEYANREITSRWEQYSDSNHKEIIRLGEIYQICLNTIQFENSTQTLNLKSSIQNSNLPCHLQYDQKQKMPLLFSQGFRPEPDAAAWKNFIKAGDFNLIIFDMIGYICEYQLLRQNEAIKYCLFSDGFSYDPTNLFFEEFKTWLCSISKYKSFEADLSSEIDKRIHYLINIINCRDVFRKREKDIRSNPINPQRKQVIVYIKDKLVDMKKTITLYQSRYSAREQFENLKIKTRNLIYDALFILFYDGSNVELPKSFILSEILHPKITSYTKLSHYTFVKILHDFLNARLIKQVFSIKDTNNNALFKIINPFLSENNEVMIPENLRILNLSSNNWCQSNEQIKSGILPYFVTKNSFSNLFLKILSDLYNIGHFYLICDTAFELSGDGGDILVYGYMGKQIIDCTSQFSNILTSLIEKLRDFSTLTQDLSEKINTKQQIQPQLINNIKCWQNNHEKAYSVWIQLQTYHKEISIITTDIIQKIGICSSYEYQQLIKQKLDFFDRLIKSFIPNGNELIDSRKTQISISLETQLKASAEYQSLDSQPVNFIQTQISETDFEIEIANTYFDSNDFNSALDSYLNLTLKYPDNPIIESRSLFCLMLFDDLAYKNAHYAMKSINRIINKYPQALEPKHVKARLEKRYGFFNDAKKTLDKILEENPEDVKARNLKMEVLQEMAAYKVYK